MNLTRCDNHPDREATATFRVRELPAGSRPLLLGYEVTGNYFDLCEECAAAFRKAPSKKIAATREP